MSKQLIDSDRLSRIHHIILDMDGTIYNGNQLFDFTPKFFDTLKRLDIHYTYLTNNSSRNVVQYLEKLHEMGLEGTNEDIYTSSLATIEYLMSNRSEIRKLYILGTDGMKSEFRESGFQVIGEEIDEEPDAVIVGFDTSLTFDHLCRAAYWIKLGKPFIATHPDRTCPTNKPTLLVDCGAICASLESATGRGPDIILGKPDPRMIWGILNRNHLEKNEVAMVGDRLYTDIEMAHRAGVMGVLVLSGENTREDANNYTTKPDLVVQNIDKFGELLTESRNQ
ncbi:MAG: HAD-IIA family hydrolase [Candidatus Marinimicrobia bacterium]|nr:HAD-IIA family hydrolase [Candidatus Neomarinimicrobiota bacterium]